MPSFSPQQDDPCSSSPSVHTRTEHAPHRFSCHPAGKLLRVLLLLTLLTGGLLVSLFAPLPAAYAASAATAAERAALAPQQPTAATETGAQKAQRLLLKLAAQYPAGLATSNTPRKVSKQSVPP